MQTIPIWIEGVTRSGKTTALQSEFQAWVRQKRPFSHTTTSAALVLAANDDNKRELADKLALAVTGSYPVLCKTPLGFITDEVMLFWPLIFESLNLKAQFPLRLRPETEQELATRLWRSQIQADFNLTGISEYRFIRQTLDLLQLAGASGVPHEDIPIRLEQGFSALDRARVLAIEETDNPQKVGELIEQWFDWCLERGLLTYGIIYELYWRYLLPDRRYQQQLSRRYQVVFADDVDDYPAIAGDLLSFWLENKYFAVFTYNPCGMIRLGLNADPHRLLSLSLGCKRFELLGSAGLAATDGATILELVSSGSYLGQLADSFISVQTTTRAELLRKTAETIIKAVKKGVVKPEEIVVIAPGLDEIARYSLMEILTSAGIAVQPLNEQRPLISSPLIRALLTLLALVYPSLGRLAPQDAVAEMLVILSRQRQDGDGKFVFDIDPVRGGLMSDYCYRVDLDNPRLQAIETFQRWDRLGHKAQSAYDKIFHWVEEMKAQQREHGVLPPSRVLNAAIEQLLDEGEHLPFDQMAALRELMETVQHFWEVDRRLRQNEPMFQASIAPRHFVIETVAQFIQLLRRGTITANPYPLRPFVKSPDVVTLGNIFQYRSLRHSHRWQFWLDCSSPLWSQGGSATLFGAPLFLREWRGEVWTSEQDLEVDRARLERIVQDLLGRVTDYVFFCHSDLGVTGTEQIGPLLSLVQGARE